MKKNYLLFVILTIFSFSFIFQYASKAQTQIDPTLFAWKDGKLLATVVSYDDGFWEDQQMLALLNKYNIVGTFNITINKLGTYGYLSYDLVKELYSKPENIKHEVANHTSTHTPLPYCDNDSWLNWELSNCNSVLSGMQIGADTKGLAYPAGLWDNRVIQAARNLGFVYARCANYHTKNFDIPLTTDYLMHWDPTEDDRADPVGYANKLVGFNQDQMALLHYYGHSQYLNEGNNWAKAEEGYKILGANSSIIWSAKTIDVANYIIALSQCVITGNSVKNNSGISIWVKLENGERKEVIPGGTQTGIAVYYRLKNKWKPNTYLKDAGDKVSYGTNPSTTDLTYQWEKIQVHGSGGAYRLKNRSTGKYMHIQGQLDQVQLATTIQPDWWSAMWFTESNHDGYYCIRNRWKTSDLINIQNMKTYAQHTGVQNDNLSAQWHFETVKTIPRKSLSTSDEKNIEDKSDALIITQCYPNPANESTTIEFTVPARGTVNLSLYNMQGAKILAILDETMEAGMHQVNVATGNLATGSYIYKITLSGATQSKSLLVQH